MAWLHGSEQCILHRDLKLSNLLYDSNLRVKICDFGTNFFFVFFVTVVRSFDH
jgi:serine/threonine protein kinase